MSETYLKTSFRNWMETQKKSNGDNYTTGTINAYTNALKNSTAKLHINGIEKTDLFYYTTVEDFDTVYNKILAAPNLNEIELTAGNKAFSNGMLFYKKFLSEISMPNCWIFQANPKYYNIIDAVKKLEIITWRTNQNYKQIKKNDKVYIWVSGTDGGIVADGSILCDPEDKEEKEDPYTIDGKLQQGKHLGVDIRIVRRFTDNIVKRNVLANDERTKRLEVLTYPGATNYRVTPEQEKVIESIISNEYIQVPVIPDNPSQPKDKKKYWMYAPGENSRLWEEFYKQGIMGIGWDELGDLKQYDSKEAMKQKMKVEYGQEYSYKNSGFATWQFANEINIGDVVFVKKGLKKIIGRGVVESGYVFDSNRSEYKHIRKVKWTHNGEWDHEGQTVLKTLTDITSYTDYCRKLEDLLGADEIISPDDETTIYDDYGKDDFLNEVFMDEQRYLTLKNLLLKKKNIILEGAPGVGKTYLAERLAFSIIGKKDTSRVKIVQFHQSYSYEDFIMGFRPTDKGFELKTGAFYDFCKEAEPDDKEYFFIIDEINRGNLSKIFGELLMLIESDKRGKGVRLLYRDEQFAVPDNVYIIGMMNTADRSLAMIDYALRRRFSFFEIGPAFESTGFKKYQGDKANKKFDNLVQVVIELNNEISKDPSLGDGFRIGHSYFCTKDIVDNDWLNSLVEYELLPLIKEYWFDEPSKIVQWSQRLRGALND